MSCPRWDNVDATPAWEQLAAEVERKACETARAERLNHRHLSRWHRDLFKDEVPLPAYAGGYRQPLGAGAHPCLNAGVHVSKVLGAAPHRVIPEMQDLMGRLDVLTRTLRAEWDHLSPKDRLMRCASMVGWAVGRFIQIHPFLNGNGRTSRLLWRVLLQRLELPVAIGIVPRPKGAYEIAMAAAMKGDYSIAIAHVLQGIAGKDPDAA